MRLWARLFPSASIYGIDESLGSPRIGLRTRLFSGKEQDVAFLDTVVAQTGPLDVIIDDDGHMESNQTVCFRKLFNHIRPGGFYAIEDLQHYNTQYQLTASSTHDQLMRIIGDTPVKDIWHTLDSAIGIIWK